MTVFNLYLKLTKKNMGLIIMYFAIFLTIAVLSSSSGAKTEENNFSDRKVSMLIADLDNSEWSETICNYLMDNHEASMTEYDEAVLYERLYYGAVSIVIVIPENFENNILESSNNVKIIQSPGSYNGYFITTQINQYICQLAEYRQLGYSLEEADKLIKGHSPTEIEIVNKSGKEAGGMPYKYFFRYIPYLFICIIPTVLGMILFKCKGEKINRRMNASAMSLSRQNLETVLSFLVVGVIVYIATFIAAVLIYGTSFLEDPHLGYYILNSVLNMAFAIGVAYIVGVIAKKDTHISMIVTPLSLVFSFLGGVFVDLSLLGDTVKTIGKVIPFYWYEQVNEIISNSSELTAGLEKEMFECFGIQIIYIIAILFISLGISRLKQQDK